MNTRPFQTPAPSLQGAVERVMAAQFQPPGMELDRTNNSVWEVVSVRCADLRTILAALPEPPSKSAESGEREALRTIAALKPEPIGEKGFSVGPQTLLDQAKRLAKAALAAAPNPPEKPRG